MIRLKRDHVLNRSTADITDFGPYPLVINIDRVTNANRNYRFALWTGEHLQVTLMSIRVGGDIGLEMHPHLDQFIRVESGHGFVKMGDRENNLTYRQNITVIMLLLFRLVHGIILLTLEIHR